MRFVNSTYCPNAGLQNDNCPPSDDMIWVKVSDLDGTTPVTRLSTYQQFFCDTNEARLYYTG